MKWPKPRKRWALYALAALVLFVVGHWGWNRAQRERQMIQTPYVWIPSGSLMATTYAQTRSLRIGIYNIAHGRGTAESNWDGGTPGKRKERLDAIAELLCAADLDVIVLNEVDFDSTWSGGVDQAAWIAQKLRFPHIVEQRNLDFAVPFFRLGFGNAVLSRYPLKSVRAIDYPAHSETEAFLAGKKRGLLCTIELDEGEDIDLLAVHLEHREEDTRVKTAEMIEDLRRASPRPFFAAGDFNSMPLGFPACETDGAGRSALSVLLDGGGFVTLPRETPGDEELTFHSQRPELLIDWVLAPSNWSIAEKEVPDTELSDHRPVFVTVRAPEKL